MKEKAVITGANGFIGSRLAETLEARGVQVLKLDRALLSLPDALKNTINKFKPSSVYHLAAYGNHYNQKEPGGIFGANLLGTFNLLEAVKTTKIDSFVNMGSSSEYGTKNKPMREDMLPETKTLYGATKVGATYLVRAYAPEFGLPAVTVRPFSVYGPNEAEHRFLPTVIRCCLTGDKLKLAPGVHDWIYIDDFVEGVISVSENAKLLSGEVVNIGSGVQYSNEKIVSLVQELCGITINIEETGNIRSFDTVTSWVANNDKLRALGWKVNTNLQKGIKSVIDAKRTNKP